MAFGNNNQDNGGNGGDHHPLYTEKVFSDRKIFFLDLKENDRGKFIKITEDVRGRRDTILVPVEALSDIIGALENIESFVEGDENPGQNEEESE